jgi:F-type H+-transporting ATPase subunit delta
MSSASALARRYAKALLEVAASSGGREVLALRDELAGFVPLVDDHAELRQALAHPGLAAAQKRRLVSAVAERAGASPLVKRLVDLLAGRARLGLLKDVAEAYAELANRSQGVVTARVASAVPLSAPQRQALEQALQGDAKQVELRAEVDPALLGGLVVRAFGQTYDGSVRTRLSALRRRLARG